MDNAILRRRKREVLGGVIVLAALALLPLPIKDVYTQNLIIITVLFAGLAQAWNILGGYCGQISLGHALYFGVGGYVSTLLYLKAGLPPSLGLFAAFGVSGLLALLVGWPCFRLSGHYYAIATVVVGEIGYLLFLNWDFVGGATGVFIPFHGESWAQLQFKTAKLPYHYVVLAFAAATWLTAFLLEGSRWGFAWRAVKDDVTAARSLGVNIFSSKMAAAALPAVLGGVSTLWGPLIGAAVLMPASELSRSYLGGSGRGVDLMLYGGLIVIVALARPQGLVSLFGRKDDHARIA